MSVPLTVNGVTFNYPVQGDIKWGPILTAWSTAVTTGMLQKAGGSFPLTAEVDFGTAFGINVLSIKSTTLPRAATGFLRLQNGAALTWRNAANSADLPLTVDSSNQLKFNGIAIGASAALTNSHIFVGNVSNQPADVAMTGDISITNAGVTSIGAGVITNSQINAAAAIAFSKLVSSSPYFWYTANAGGVLSPVGVTASRAVITDANGLPSASGATSTEVGYLSGVTAAIQTQINTKLNKAGDTMTGVLNMGGNKIQSVANGTAASDAINFGQIKYLQATQSTNSTPFTTSSTSYADTHLTGTITPTSASNRVKITVSTVASASSNERAIYGVNRGVIHLSTNGFVQTQVIGQVLGAASVCFSYIDFPATTTPLTYTVEIKSGAGGSISDCPLSGTASIILEEVV